MHELTEIIDLSNYTVEHSGASGTMISLRGGVIPLEALKKYIQVEKADKEGKRNTFAGVPALVVKHGSNLIAFQIDGVLGQQSVVVRPLNEQMSSIGGFSGSTVLGDGEPGMILNLSEIARQYFARSQGQEQYR
jgi:chemotaxis protein histidine kinase CheA